MLTKENFTARNAFEETKKNFDINNNESWPKYITVKKNKIIDY